MKPILIYYLLKTTITILTTITKTITTIIAIILMTHSIYFAFFLLFFHTTCNICLRSSNFANLTRFTCNYSFYFVYLLHFLAANIIAIIVVVNFLKQKLMFRSLYVYLNKNYQLQLNYFPRSLFMFVFKTILFLLPINFLLLLLICYWFCLFFFFFVNFNHMKSFWMQINGIQWTKVN